MDDRTRNLKEYFPQIYDNITEIQEIALTEQPIIDDIDYHIHEIFKNSFIVTSDEEGISRYEDLLGITPEKFDTLETRRLSVLSSWSTSTLFTYRILLQRLSQICGDNKFEVEKDFDNFRIIIKLYNIERTLVEAVKQLGTKLIPANMIWWVNQSISFIMLYTERLNNFKINLINEIVEYSDKIDLTVSNKITIFETENINNYLYRLNGEWILDGSVKLNSMIHDMNMNMKLSINNKENIYATINGEPV